MDIRLQLSPIKDQNCEKTHYSVALTDISELVHLSSSANLQQRCLELANTTEDRASLLIGYVQLIKTYLDCEAAGIRMEDTDGGMPYLVYEGFSPEWIESARLCCPKSDACLCDMVIRDATDPDQSFFTPRGSFYINNIRRFLATTTTAEMTIFKPDCLRCGYGAMAMIPIAVDNTRWGVLHLADHRENQFPLRVIETLELVASRLGLAIHRLNLQEHLLQSQKDLDDLSRHLLTIQEEEQRRIALDLHDGCGQNLNVLKLRLQFLQNQLPNGAAYLSDQCNALISLTDSILDEIRSIAHGLKPAALETLGLVPATRQLLRNLRDQYEVYIETHIDMLGEIGDPTVQVCLYRIFQEALNNIIKHAQATWILFAVRKKNEVLRIIITDNGIGFDIPHPKERADGTHGMGLQAIALRCRMIGADMTLESHPGKGTRLTICLPTQERTSSQ
jgi:signal transduction histidine kinase